MKIKSSGPIRILTDPDFNISTFEFRRPTRKRLNRKSRRLIAQMKKSFDNNQPPTVKSKE